MPKTQQSMPCNTAAYKTIKPCNCNSACYRTEHTKQWTIQYTAAHSPHAQPTCNSKHKEMLTNTPHAWMQIINFHCWSSAKTANSYPSGTWNNTRWEMLKDTTRLKWNQILGILTWRSQNNRLREIVYAGNATLKQTRTNAEPHNHNTHVRSFLPPAWVSMLLILIMCDGHNCQCGGWCL